MINPYSFPPGGRLGRGFKWLKGRLGRGFKRLKGRLGLGLKAQSKDGINRVLKNLPKF